MKRQQWKILLISEHADNTFFIQEYLSEAEHLEIALQKSDQPQQALETLKEAGTDIVLLDLSSISVPANEMIQSVIKTGHTVIALIPGEDHDLMKVALESGADEALFIDMLNTPFLLNTMDYLFELKRQQSEIQELELEVQSYLPLLEKFPEGIAIVNDSRIVIYANPSARELLFGNEHAAHGKAFPLPLDQRSVKTEWTDATHGHSVELELHSCPITWKEEPAFFVVVKDVTDQQRELQEGQQQSEAFQYLLQKLPQGIVIVNSSHEILMINPSAAKFMGKLPDELVGTQFDIPFEEEWSKTRKITIDSTGAVAHIRLEKMLWKGQQAYLFFLEDITEKTRQEEKSLRQKAVLEVIAKTAHRMGSTQNLTEEILPGLAEVGKLTGVHHAIFLGFDKRGSHVDEVIEWVADQHPSLRDYWKQLPIDGFSWLRSRMISEDKPFEMLPHHIAMDVRNQLAFLEKESIPSVTFFPVKTKEKPLGLLVFSMIGQEKRWEEDEQILIQAFGQLLSRSIEKKTSERLARERERLYRIQFENFPDGMVLAELSEDETLLSIREVNDALSHQLGYQKEELLEMTIQQLEDPKRWIESQKNLQTILEDGHAVFEMAYTSKYGGLQPMEVHARAFEISGKKAVLYAVRGVTGRKSQEQKLQIHLQRLKSLRAIDISVASSLDVRSALNLYLDQIIHQLHFDAAAIALIDPASYTLEYQSAKGFARHNPSGLRLRLGEGFGGRVVMENRPIMIAHIQQTHRKDRFLKVVQEEGFYSYYGIPLVARGEVKGVLEVLHRSTMHDDTETLDFMEIMAGQLSVAIDNLSMIQQLKRSVMETQMGLDQVLETWAQSIEDRMRKPKGSSLARALKAVDIGRSLGIAESQLIHVKRGALLSDLGMLSVGEDILFTSESLNEDHWALIHKHPEYARDILQQIPFLKDLMDIPLYHHERWDGEGYPYGLKGDRIPIAARIFKVIDVAEALSQPRPYRDAWSKQEIDAYLEEQSGKEFDPDIVSVMLSQD